MRHSHSPGPWKVNPNYGQSNQYNLWDENSNYHEDTSPEVMDANCHLIEQSPAMLKLLTDIHKRIISWVKNDYSNAGLVVYLAQIDGAIENTLDLATGQTDWRDDRQ